MAKKKKSIAQDIVVSGAGLSLGATAVGALPASAAQAGVLGGMGTVGTFFKPMATVGAAGIVVKQLKGIPRQDGSGGGVRANRGRGGCIPPRDRGIKSWRQNLW